MDDLDKMAAEAEKYTKANLAKKKNELNKEIETFEFKTLLDAVELLFELRAKREKSIKDITLIDIIEKVLEEEPFEYKDEDYILSAFKDTSGEHRNSKKKRR